MSETKRELFKRLTWSVQRVGEIHEVVDSHGSIRYNVLVSDGDRLPFISRWFNDPVPASDFLEKMQTGYDAREGRKLNGP